MIHVWQVWASLRAVLNDGKLETLSLLGLPVCQIAYKRLLRLGSGRFARLSASVRSGEDTCPLDMRRLPRKFLKTMNSPKRLLVHDFLHELYETLAEPMPEGTGASKRPRTIRKRDDTKMAAVTHLIEKALPPGSFYEYLAMLRRAHPQETFSYKLFCSAWALVFLQLGLLAATVCAFLA